MSFDKFGITASTIGCPPLRKLAEVCQRVGLTYLSIWPPHTYRTAIAEGFTPASIKALLSDHGLQAHDADAVVLWVGPDDPGGPYFEEAPEPEVFEAAHAFGTPYVNALLTGRRKHASVEAAADKLGSFADRCAAQGLAVTVEFATRSAVNDLATGIEVIRATGRKNVGICLDTWAVHWGGASADVLATAAPYVHTVQINDAPAETPADFAHATRYHRLVPGDGVIDYRALLGPLTANGCTAPLVLEVFNDEQLAAEGVDGFAQRCADATRRVASL